MKENILKEGRCYIGTSGWSYSHWAKGVFYPRGMKSGEWLPYFSQHFSTVEINSSFYRLPRLDIVKRWRDVTGAGFQFAVKLWRRITHERKLANCTRELKDFFAAAVELGPKRGPLLIQLPPFLKCNLELLEGFLTELNSVTGETRWKVTVEFRNTEWLCEPVYQLLNRYDVALCLADMPRCPITEPNNASLVYIRRHGPGGTYSGCYPPEEIAGDAARIREWLREGRDVYVYYNNDIDGHAVTNARQLIEAVNSKLEND